MNKDRKISDPVIKRLPRYYRFLGELAEKNVQRISSRELSDKMGLTASQIRQDLNCFGGFGQQGYGYSVQVLRDEIGHILGIDNCYKAVLFGAGNLGKAIAVHLSFEKIGFRLIGIFDNDTNKVGTKINDLTVMSEDELENFCQRNQPDAAIFCVPKSSASELLEKLYVLGIKNYWNFSHYDLAFEHDDVIVENVHLNDSLMVLCYKISNKNLHKEN